VREQTADQQVRQALNRLGFGARPGDYERVRAMGVDQWIARQLEPSSIDDRQMDTILERFPTLIMSSAELMRSYPPPQMLRAKLRARARASGTGTATRTDADSTTQPAFGLSPADSQALALARRQARRVIGELQAAKLARAVESNRQLEEVMVDFWENHFNVFAGKGPERYYLASFERDAIRPNALGHFRDLLEAVAKSPAMLYYLDNWRSSVDSGRPALRDARGRRASGVGRRERPTVRFRRPANASIHPTPDATRPQAGTRPTPAAGATPARQHPAPSKS
jgi:uncharacterized protein (DUF1800 family)